MTEGLEPWSVPIPMRGKAIHVSIRSLFVSPGKGLRERSGQINLTQESALVDGPLATYALAFKSYSAWVGVESAALAGVALGMLHGWFCRLHGLSDIANGIALNLLGIDLAVYFGKPYAEPVVPNRPSHRLGTAPDIPQVRAALDVNAKVLMGIVLAFAVARSFRTIAIGRRRRVVGDTAHAARASGIARDRVRLCPTAAGGWSARVGGADLSLYNPGRWIAGLLSGLGSMTDALVIVARGTPIMCFFAALPFGAAHSQRMVGRVRRNMAAMDLVVVTEHAPNGRPVVAAFKAACVTHKTWDRGSIMEVNSSGVLPRSGLIIDDLGAIQGYCRRMRLRVPLEPWSSCNPGVPNCDGTIGSQLTLIIRHDDVFPEMPQGPSGRADETDTDELRPDLIREARRGWLVDVNIYQLGHPGYVAVKKGAGDGPHTHITDLVRDRPCRRSVPPAPRSGGAGNRRHRFRLYGPCAASWRNQRRYLRIGGRRQQKQTQTTTQHTVLSTSDPLTPRASRLPLSGPKRDPIGMTHP